MAIQKFIEILTPCIIATPQNYILKFGTHDFVGNIIKHANFGQIGSAGGSPQMREILTHVTIYTVLTFFLDHLHRLNRGTDVFLRKEMLLWG